ncbi:hypothetical protein BH11PSE11_BH11PSE11_04920 [soil metagenome]
MLKLKIVAAIGFLALVAASPARADLFKCKNETGKILYSDRPCESNVSNVAPGTNTGTGKSGTAPSAQLQKLAQANKSYRCRASGPGVGSRMKCTEE